MPAVRKATIPVIPLFQRDDKKTSTANEMKRKIIEITIPLTWTQVKT
jgi:hypothetical protein